MRKTHLALLFVLWSCADVLTKTSACSYLPNVENAYISTASQKDNYTHGDVLYFTCHSGFVSRGRISYRCDHQSWLLNHPGKCERKLCGHPGDTLNGQFNLEQGKDFVFGAEVKYDCNEGYMMASQRDTRKCEADGWSNSVPHCEVVKCMPEQTGDNIIVTGMPENVDHLPYGSALQFECTSSNHHKLKGNSEIYCTSNGTWSSPFPTCEETKLCGAPPAVANAVIVGSRRRSYRDGERIEYKCKADFETEGLSSVICDNGQWTSPPICKRLIYVCGSAPRVEGAIIVTRPQDSYSDGESIQYACTRHYVLEGQAVVRCVRRQWTTPPVCRKPCVVTAEEMLKRNIRFRWPKPTTNLPMYVPHKDYCEFVCVRGTNTRDRLRLQCKDSYFNTPTCKGGGGGESGASQ
ncbi:complement factor H isoform X2 [Amia ocellicauda]|uniref:complement factor H isoform X2 n=1 Tax=Amia ocellicauda TaxID=2972642 RepID=UPI003464C1D9